MILSSLILLIILLTILICIDCTGPPGSVPMKIVNYAGKPLELFWIDTNSGKKDKTGPLMQPLHDSIPPKR